MSKEEAERAKEEWNGIKREVKKRKKRDNMLSGLKMSRFNRTPEMLVWSVYGNTKTPTKTNPKLAYKN